MSHQPPAQKVLVAADIMTPNPACVEESELVKNIEDYFDLRKISSIPVVNEKRELTGIISKVEVTRAQQIKRIREFLELIYMDAPGEIQRLQEFYHLDSYDEVTVGEIMAEMPLTAFETSRIRDMAHQMIEHHAHRVVILNQSKNVVGLVSTLDIIKACFP